MARKIDNTDVQTALVSLEYDPLNSELTVLHRAGIAGLLLQIKTMQKLRDDMPESEQAKYVIPQCKFIHDGRGIYIEFTEASFYALMNERYKGILAERILGKATHKKRLKLASEEKRFEFIEDIGNDKFLYLDPKPLLRHYEVFKAHETWQAHARDACFSSYYCIPNNQPIFKLPSEGEERKKIGELWTALRKDKSVKLDKSLCPSIFSKNLKGTKMQEYSKLALLLHFWPLVTTHFTPINLKAEKDKATGRKIIRNDWQSPVIVIPDVINAQTFVEDFIDHLGSLGAPPTSKLYSDGRYIATPLEASLAYFAAPRLARGVRNKVGTSGAEVYVFRQRPKIDKQSLVIAIVNESFEPRLVEEYERLLARKITSLPLRAVCVENLLAQPKQELYEGFERLVDQYPLELFIALKPTDGGLRRFRIFGYQMAHSLLNEFRTIETKERKKMNDSDATIPALIWRITRRYIRWRACSKAEPPVGESEVNRLFEKKRNQQDLATHEKNLLGRYNKAVGDVVEKLFIDFRGYREREAFANAFTETLFRAPQNLKPELAEKLQPFLEGKDDWESGRRLVLMAISAAGATASDRGSGDAPDAIPQMDANDSETPE